MILYGGRCCRCVDSGQKTRWAAAVGRGAAKTAERTAAAERHLKLLLLLLLLGGR